MGRIGINFDDVKEKAYQLQGRGKSPTVDAIRDLLGTGSKSTIAQHLKTWKAEEKNGEGNLPQELLALVTGLWERLNAKAEQRITDIQRESEEKIKLIQQTLTQTQADQAQLKSKLHQVEETSAAEQLIITDTKNQLTHYIQENEKLNEKYQTSVKQLEASKADNDRLHKLAAHIQTNLEHYQNSMQELRTEQNLSIEKQQAIFQQQITDLQQEIALCRSQRQESDKQLNHKTQELQQLHEKYHSLQSAHEKLAQENKETAQEFIISKERYKQSQDTLNIQEEKLKSDAMKMLELEKQIVLLTEKTNNLEKNLKKSEEKIENLRHEKMFLVQEKSELQGYLKKSGNKERG
ncbi:MAG: DNA-binding protein [Parachlamydiaceae bacterium]|nr:DNA-binding protein [Parachlamydiaceae bacterium]